MKICVYGAASTEIDKKYIDAVEELCEKLAKRGHNLIFGAGDGGVMGAAARGFKKGGGTVVGVAPDFFTNNTIEKLYSDCDTLIRTDSMGVRKAIMESNADAFIVGPGGIGTYDELFQILTLKQLKVFDKPIVVYNIAHYYDAIGAQLKTGLEEKFLRSDTPSLCKVFNETQMQELIDYLEAYDYDYTTENGHDVDVDYGDDLIDSLYKMMVF